MEIIYAAPPITTPDSARITLESRLEGRITINGQQAKASSNVKIGDELVVRFGQRLVTVKVENLQENTRKEDAAGMYTVLKDERINQE